MPTVIDLSTLTNAQGFFIQGDAADDRAGRRVSNAGDINGDGVDDIIVGAFLGDDGGYDASEAYVIYGKMGTERGTIDLTGLAASDGFIIQGDAARDRAGVSVSGAGDINGDGIDDIVVGAYRGDDGGTDAGEAYVIYGKTGWTRGTIDLTGLAESDGFIIQGDAAYDQAGTSVSGAGDVNGDGIDDLIVGARRGDDGGTDAGEAYVIYGITGTSRGTVDLTGLAASAGFIIVGDSRYDSAGTSVSGAGDVNGDGIGDLIVGAPFGDDGGSYAGEAYVIFGKIGVTRGTVDLTGLTGSDGFIIQGDAAEDRAGISVSDAGDINGDGIADLIVGASNASSGGSRVGETYVIYGKMEVARGTLDLTSLAVGDGFRIVGNATAARAGYSVSGAGDVNGDGIDDLIVGASGVSSSTGAGYVIYGRTGLIRGTVSLSALAAADGIIIQGEAAGEQASFSVSGAGDINGDGIADLVVGAPYSNDGGRSAGAAYVIYGTIVGADNNVFTNGGANQAFDGQAGFDQIDMSAFTGPVTLNTAAGTIVSAEGGNDTVTNVEFFTLGSGDDVVTFGDNGFVVRTGLGDDQVTGGTGRDLVSGGDGDDTLAGGAGAANELGGGDGNDIYIVSVRGDSTIEAVGGGFDEVRTALGVYQLQANIEALTFTDNAAHAAGIGNALDNAITGGTGRDDLFGRDGNDTLTGGTGAANTLIGGAGDDVYFVSVAGDSIIEAAGEGTDEVVTALNLFTLRDNVEILTFTGTGAFTGIGSNTDNLLYGGESNDFLSGRGGNDKIYGGAGDDILIGGAGADEFAMSFGGSGIGTGVERILDFTSGTDKLSFADRIVGQSENFVLVQGAGPQVATTFDATFLYNSSNGRLFYDINGAGEGGGVLYAILNPGLTLNVGDFIIY